MKELQNGSDIRGVALEGLPGEAVNLTPQVAERLGMAFGVWLGKQGMARQAVAVGMDSRLSGPALKASFSKGLTYMGCRVYDCGLASTPAMFMATLSESLRADAGVMLTASHLPWNRNGLKFFTRQGGLNKQDITDIIGLAMGDMPGQHRISGEVAEVDFMAEYASYLVDYIRKTVNDPDDYDRPLQGLKIVVDAGNGAGGFFAAKVLAALGSDTAGSQFLEPDGMFPNHIPNPEDEQAMNSLCAAVIEARADLGIIFDTDVDRAAIADNTGQPVNRNSLIALISAIVLREHPGSIIVTDSITSEGLTRFIEDELKGVHHRFKRGYKNVINEALRLNNEGKACHLAIETSGHAALKENFFLDDGAFLVAKILAEMAILKRKKTSLMWLIRNLQTPAESREYRLTIPANDFREYGNKVIRQVTAFVAEQDDWQIQSPNYEGLRVRCTGPQEKGWFLLRLSLHDPVMPLNIESAVEGGVARIAKRLQAVLPQFL